MNGLKKIKIAFVTSIVFLFLMSSSFLLMPFAVNSNDNNNLNIVLIGLLFWVSALIGYVAIIVASKIQKHYMHEKYGGNNCISRRIGLLTFFSNFLAKVADISFLSSFLLFVIINLTDFRSSYFAYIFLFVLVFSLNMHALFNGRIYRFIEYENLKRGNHYE